MNKINLSADSNQLLLSYDGNVLSYPLNQGLLIKIFNNQPVVVLEKAEDNIPGKYNQVKVAEGKLTELFYEQEKKYTYLVGELDLEFGIVGPGAGADDFIINIVDVVEDERNCCVLDFAENILHIKRMENGDTIISVLTEKNVSTHITNGELVTEGSPN